MGTLPGSPDGASRPRPAQVKQAFKEELQPGQQSALVSWIACAGTFALVRAITCSIKDGMGPLHNVSVGGVHLHHYMWGILAVSGVGGVAHRGEDRLRRHPLVAAAYGIGLALIVDELALLVDLKDVYRAQPDRESVDLAIGLISTSGSLLVSRPILRRLRHDRQG